MATMMGRVTTHVVVMVVDIDHHGMHVVMRSGEWSEKEAEWALCDHNNFALRCAYHTSFTFSFEGPNA